MQTLTTSRCSAVKINHCLPFFQIIQDVQHIQIVQDVPVIQDVQRIQVSVTIRYLIALTHLKRIVAA